MRKFLPVLAMALLLAGCGLIDTPTAISGDAEMATRVAQILTSMPTATNPAEGGIPTPLLPTIQPSPTTAQPATATQTPPAAGTALPSGTPSTTPTASLTAQPTSSYTPPASDPTTKLGSADWTDDMDNGDSWPTGADSFTDIAFASGAMRLTGLSTTDGWRMTYPNVTNFYLEAVFQVNDCSGADRYGLIARVPLVTAPDRGYIFGFTCDGQYSLRRWNASVGVRGEMVNLVEWKTSSAINAGPTQTNRMGLMAIGDRLILYANGQQLAEVRDSAFSSGYFGVFVGARETDNFTIRVDQLRMWEDPGQ